MPFSLFGHPIHVRAWLHDMRIAFGSLVGQHARDHAILQALHNRPHLLRAFAEFQGQMPQAEVVDDSVTRCEYIDWREYFAAKLKGRGLEIGALHQPLATHSGMTMTYLDYADVAALQRASPELDKPIVPVDIVDDAEELRTVPDASYDFLVASHVFEHMRNPIGALRHWLRVVVPGGHVYLVVPDKRWTFDRHRVRTLLEHLILDYQEPSRERDFDHYVEYAVHVQRSDTLPALAEARRLLSIDYSIHFHAFLPKDLVALVRWMNEHVTPVAIAEGPVMRMRGDEFHLLLTRPPTSA